MSISYISLIENGHKVPEESVAVALARALGEDPALFSAWIRARKRTDLAGALAAAETLRRLLGAERAGSLPSVASRSPSRQRRRDPAAPAARLRVPVIPAGVDPGEAVRPSCAILEWRGLDLEEIPAEARARLVRPFALLLTDEAMHRVPGLLGPWGHAIVLREFMPLSPQGVYAVRHGGGIVLSRVLWNGGHLLLLPADGESDFVVIEAPGEREIRALIVGLAMAVRFEEARA